VAKALSPAKVKEVRINEDTGVAEVIVPDYQLSLAIGKEGQNARLSARLTGWRVDIKSETQLAEEETYAQQDWAEGEWVVDAETGEQVWQPAEGGPAMSAEAWEAAVSDEGGDAAPAEGDTAPAAGDAAPVVGDESVAVDVDAAPVAAAVTDAPTPVEDVDAELDAEDAVATDVAELAESSAEAEGGPDEVPADDAAGGAEPGEDG